MEARSLQHLGLGHFSSAVASDVDACESASQSAPRAQSASCRMAQAVAQLQLQLQSLRVAILCRDNGVPQQETS